MLTARPHQGQEVDDAPPRPAAPAVPAPRRSPAQPDAGTDLGGPDLGGTVTGASATENGSATDDGGVSPGLLRLIADRHGRGALRVGVVTAAALVACAGTLDRLWPACRDQAGAAFHLAVLPAGAVLLLLRGRPAPGEPDIHDRQVDYLVGLPLLGVAVFVLTAMPARLGDRFWTTHADLLLLPPLMAAAVALVFGTRAMWRLRAPLLLLTATLTPLPEAAARWPARPVAAALRPLVRPLAGSPLAGPTLTGPALTGALTGAAGVSAALALALLLGCSARRPTRALRRGVMVLALWATLVVGRIAVAVLAVRVGAPGAARTALGVGGDLAVLALLFGMLAVAGAPRAARSARAGASRPVRRAAVDNSRWALVVVVASAATLATLGALLPPALAGTV
ncbi:hypothetical protein [Frankia tisae]|uniref:hypothetical protein n=1 Tax=Frankia tisae TaxID=2950104 RepID=UPI0021BE4029|nr:hypothetical protein [Frankia tisae]